MSLTDRACNRQTGSLVLIIALLLTGCSRQSPEPSSLSMQEVPGAISNAFKDAPPELNKAATEISLAVADDDPSAWEALQRLSNQPDLTEAQRQAAARSMTVVLSNLQASVQKGDKKAEEEMKRYQASK
jgi:hypothetical protein